MTAAIFHSLASALALSLVALASLSSITAQAASEINVRAWIGEYENLVQPLLAVFFVLTGLILVLFAHIAPYAFLKTYTRSGQSVEGHSLSCEQMKEDNYDTAILYKYKGTRYLRRVTLAKAKKQGEAVEFLVRPSNPQQGLPRETVEAELASFSHVKTLLIAIPGWFATAVVTWYAEKEAREMQDTKFADLVIIGALTLCCSLGITIGSVRWENEKHRKFTQVWSRNFGHSKPGDNV